MDKGDRDKYDYSSMKLKEFQNKKKEFEEERATLAPLRDAEVKKQAAGSLK